MSDESAYRGHTHPPYCTCVDCQQERRTKVARGSLVTKLLRMLRLKR